MRKRLAAAAVTVLLASWIAACGDGKIPDDAGLSGTAGSIDQSTMGTSKDGVDTLGGEGAELPAAGQENAESGETSEGQDAEGSEEQSAELEDSGQQSEGQAAETLGQQSGSLGYSSYEELIAKVLAVFEDRDSYTGEEGFSSIFYDHWEYETLGYLTRDLDGDGTEELIFGANTDGWDGGSWDGIVYNLYTVRDGQVVQVLNGWERNRYYLCENGAIAGEGSGSASEEYYSFYQYQDGELVPIESLYLLSEEEQSWSYTTKFSYTESGVAQEELEPIGEAEAEEIIGKYVHSHPQFTPFILADEASSVSEEEAF